MKKSLVAYFSAGGVTQAVAENLAGAIGADLFEIEPEVRYTQTDLDWQNSRSRSSLEMKNKDSRPAIAAEIENMEQYDVVFIGFPIWWYREPTIIDTFMEAYDFSGKTVVPFATSGGSGLGEAPERMQEMAKGSVVESGKRFPAGVSGQELKEWAEAWL